MNGLSADERAALLAEVVAEAAQLCDLIDVPPDLRPAANPTARYEIKLEPEFGLDGLEGYRFVLWTRYGGMSWHIAEALIEQRDAFLFDVFEQITSAMASFVDHLDSAVLFDVQQALMRRLSAEWGDAFAERRAFYLRDT